MRMSCYQRLTRATETNMEVEFISCNCLSVLCCVFTTYAYGKQLHMLDPNAIEMDTLGIEPRASRMLSGCDTTTPCARKSVKLVRETMPNNEWRHVRITYAMQ